MTVRLAMWSGPRNLSTTMMRAFESRPDTEVSDEPFYAAYLAATGLDHPMRLAVLAAQPTDWRQVAAALTGPAPRGATVWYQKHMCHHMLPEFGLDWSRACRHAFLIRRPEAVLASYAAKREDPTLDDIGYARQAELFDRFAQDAGYAPPVIDAQQVLADPRGSLIGLCAALGIGFNESMLSWRSGRRLSDGVWAPHWYANVERSTGFREPSPAVERSSLPQSLARVAEQALPFYEKMAMHRLRGGERPMG